MKVNTIYYNIHSMLYIGIAADDSEYLYDSNYGIYHERELLCEKRWRAAIANLPDDAIYAQLYGGPEILPYARQVLGEDRVIAPAAEQTEGMDSNDLAQALNDSLLEQLKDKGHELDMENTRIEAWGVSFEGCAYGYSTRLNRHLGLKHPVYVNFDMCVPTRLLCNAELITHFLLPGTPVRGYVFDGPEGYAIGVFFEGFARAGAGQSGRIRLGIDNTKVTIENSSGITLYANLCIDRPDGRKIPIHPQRSHEDVVATDDGLELPRGNTLWIKASYLSPAGLIEAMRNATVTED